jgi:hypothetical protein
LNGFNHLLTRPAFIRVPNPDAYGPHKAVLLTLVVSATGDVIAVSPRAGPTSLYRRAIEIASEWKFAPFTQDGRATAARVERVLIPIHGPELWNALPAGFPEYKDPESVVVGLKRYAPEEGVATIEVRGDGSVTFVGDHGAALQGKHCARIDRASLDALLADIKRANFFAMRTHYNSARGSAVMFVAVGDWVKEVKTSIGEVEQAPESFWQLVDAIMASVHADRWTKGDMFTGPSLLAERWDFGKRGDENYWMTARIAKRGDPGALRDLLALNAPLMTKPRPSLFAPSYIRGERTALEQAAIRGSRDMADLLLRSKSAWSQEAIDGAYVAALEHGDFGLVSILRARGARNQALDESGKTALIAAAASGRPDLVEQILRTKPSVNEMDDAPLSALHWAVAPDYQLTLDSVHANRRGVIDALIGAGARVDAVGSSGWTPLISNWMGLEEVTAGLIAHGANVNAQDDDGKTPLMTNMSPRAVQLLLDAGADPYVRNKEGKNALDVARGDLVAWEVVPVLERWMAAHPRREVN